MGRRGDTRTLRERLLGAQRGLRGIERTRNRDSRRVMLGCLLEDLDALAVALAGEEPTGEDRALRALRALYTELRDAARRLRRELGGPVAPDDPGEPAPDRRRKRIVRDKSKDRAAVEPPPEQEPDSSSGGEWTGRGLSPF